VRAPSPGLPERLAEELARIHAIPPARLPFLGRADLFERLLAELDTVDEPHPAIELGIVWCRQRLPLERPAVVSHGDFRIGNMAIDEQGLVAVLDWEFAKLADPAEDLAWPLVRAWRFGADDRRLGGVGDVEPYLARYAELTGVEVGLDELYAWEVLGNVKWAIGSLTQARRHLRGEERSVELAVLGRLSAEMEAELLHLLGHFPASDGARDGDGPHDRPSAGELAAAVREFLEGEVLPAVAADQRLRFRTLVAMNALGIVERESPPLAERDWTLARRIRAGDLRPGDAESIASEVRAKLRTASPRALERYA
jgi:hypothetical protein